MQFARIVALSVSAAVAYGILHDQVTARLCVEYFTVGHPLIIATDDPTLLALLWGVLATWWVGVLLGVPLALLSRVGSWPKVAARDLVRPMLRVTACVAVFAAGAGTVGYVSATRGGLALGEPLASRIPHQQHVWFLVDAFAHPASYLGGLLGGLALCGWVVRYRRRLARKARELSTRLESGGARSTI